MTAFAARASKARKADARREDREWLVRVREWRKKYRAGWRPEVMACDSMFNTEAQP